MANKYDNALLTGNVNINLPDKGKDTKNHWTDLCHTLLLKNLLLEKTCFKSHEETLLNVMLTNRPKSFHSNSVVETDLGDYHKLILFF